MLNPNNPIELDERGYYKYYCEDQGRYPVHHNRDPLIFSGKIPRAGGVAMDGTFPSAGEIPADLYNGGTAIGRINPLP